MLTNDDIKTYQNLTFYERQNYGQAWYINKNLTFTTSENINNTFYYFQRPDCADLKKISLKSHLIQVALFEYHGYIYLTHNDKLTSLETSY